MKRQSSCKAVQRLLRQRTNAAIVFDPSVLATAIKTLRTAWSEDLNYRILVARYVILNEVCIRLTVAKWLANDQRFLETVRGLYHDFVQAYLANPLTDVECVQIAPIFISNEETMSDLGNFPLMSKSFNSHGAIRQFYARNYNWKASVNRRKVYKSTLEDGQMSLWFGMVSFGMTFLLPNGTTDALKVAVNPDWTFDDLSNHIFTEPKYMLRNEKGEMQNYQVAEFQIKDQMGVESVYNCTKGFGTKLSDVIFFRLTMFATVWGPQHEEPLM